MPCRLAFDFVTRPDPTLVNNLKNGLEEGRKKQRKERRKERITELYELLTRTVEGKQTDWIEKKLASTLLINKSADTTALFFVA